MSLNFTDIIYLGKAVPGSGGGGGGGSGLPDQTGHSGEFLTTDGTDASWSDKPLVNRATGTNGIGIGGSSLVASGNNSIAVGPNPQATAAGAIAIGVDARATVADGIAIGDYARSSANKAYQIGSGTNGTANSFQVGSRQLLNLSDGTIPSDRLVHAINKYSTMPTAASTNEGWIVQFTGTTDSTYTHGHLYECVSDGQDPATYSWTEVSMGGGSGLPSQTGNAGKFLTTDGTDASWSDKPLVNTATGNSSLTILGTATNGTGSINIGVGSSVTANNGNGIAIGQYSRVEGTQAGIAIGSESRAGGMQSISLGQSNKATGQYSIQIGGFHKTNSDANTFKVGNNNGNYEMMDANGNLPADRLASTTGLADGNYRLRLTMTNGVPTLSWVAE